VERTSVVCELEKITHNLGVKVKGRGEREEGRGKREEGRGERPIVF